MLLPGSCRPSMIRTRIWILQARVRQLNQFIWILFEKLTLIIWGKLIKTYSAQTEGHSWKQKHVPHENHMCDIVCLDERPVQGCSHMCSSLMRDKFTILVGLAISEYLHTLVHCHSCDKQKELSPTFCIWDYPGREKSKLRQYLEVLRLIGQGSVPLTAEAGCLVARFPRLVWWSGSSRTSTLTSSLHICLPLISVFTASWSEKTMTSHSLNQYKNKNKNNLLIPIGKFILHILPILFVVNLNYTC